MHTTFDAIINTYFYYTKLRLLLSFSQEFIFNSRRRRSAQFCVLVDCSRCCAVAAGWFAWSQIILVRGKILKVEGMLSVGSLGRAEKNAAPVVIDPIGRGVGGKITVSGDYKVTFCFDVVAWKGKSPSVGTR